MGERAKPISVNDLIESLQEIDNGEFTEVSFLKRSTGELRRITGRFGVTRHLRGGEAAYNFKSKNLLSIWIPESSRREENKSKGGYRAVPIEGITEIAAHGKRFVVSDGMATKIN